MSEKKKCLLCGAHTSNEAPSCPQCGEATFGAASGVAPVVIERDNPPETRIELAETPAEGTPAIPPPAPAAEEPATQPEQAPTAGPSSPDIGADEPPANHDGESGQASKPPPTPANVAPKTSSSQRGRGGSR